MATLDGSCRSAPDCRRRTRPFARVWPLLGCLLLGACTAFPSFSDQKGPRRAGTYSSGASGASGVRIVTYNIEYGDHIDRAATEIQGDVELSAADVVTVQEVSGAEAEDLARRLRMNFVYYPGTLREGDEFGQAVLSRYAITNDFKLVLPHQNRLGGGIRIAVGAELQQNGRAFLVYSIHNETFVISPRQRLDQVKTVLKDADARRLPVIVAGDFNTMEAFARAETARVFREAGYIHATRGSGRTAYPWHGPVGVVLDHVFVRGFDVVRAGTRPGSSSDHLPLFAEVRWSAAPLADPNHSEGPAY